jgi:predicted esterase
MMVFQSKNITVPKTARYWLGEDQSGTAHTIILLLHGYGMSALSCIEQFNGLGRDGVLLVAPEGLSRFYRKGFDGEVVASWMTREDRLNEINDQIIYLDRVLDEVVLKQAPLAHKVVVVGYSQGVATGARWIKYREGKGIQTFVAYAGDIPAEIIEMGWPDTVKVVQVFSETDEFIPSAKFHDQASKLQASAFNVVRLKYNGGHAILQEAVSMISEEL